MCNMLYLTPRHRFMLVRASSTYPTLQKDSFKGQPHIVEGPTIWVEQLGRDTRYISDNKLARDLQLSSSGSKLLSMGHTQVLINCQKNRVYTWWLDLLYKREECCAMITRLNCKCASSYKYLQVIAMVTNKESKTWQVNLHCSCLFVHVILGHGDQGILLFAC